MQAASGVPREAWPHLLDGGGKNGAMANRRQSEMEEEDGDRH